MSSSLGDGPPFLAVDSANVYVSGPSGIVRIPKSGAAASLVNGAGVSIFAVTTLDGAIYWVDGPPGTVETPDAALSVRSAPLLGGPISSLATFPASSTGVPGAVGVTSDTVFLLASALFSFPRSTGIPSGGLALVPGSPPCGEPTSDTNAIDCANAGAVQNLAILSNGSVTPLGPQVNSSYIVFDATNVYWADNTTVGTIMKAPKAGGGAATVIARDTSPSAIAVDSVSVYWSDAAGFIKSVPK